MTTGTEYGQNVMNMSSVAFSKSPKTPMKRTSSSGILKQSVSRNNNISRT